MPTANTALDMGRGDSSARSAGSQQAAVRESRTKAKSLAYAGVENAMMIISHGESFPAFVCRVCGARDTSERDLAIHASRHITESAYLKGELRLLHQKFLVPGICNEPGCTKQVATRGKCKQHWQLRYSRRKAGIE